MTDERKVQLLDEPEVTARLTYGADGSPIALLVAPKREGVELLQTWMQHAIDVAKTSVTDVLREWLAAIDEGGIVVVTPEMHQRALDALGLAPCPDCGGCGGCGVCARCDVDAEPREEACGRCEGRGTVERDAERTAA